MFGYCYYIFNIKNIASSVLFFKLKLSSYYQIINWQRNVVFWFKKKYFLASFTVPTSHCLSVSLLLPFITYFFDMNLVCLAGDDESKLDDAHSLGSGAGEGYEPISDDELDEILAGDAEKREDQQEEEKMPGNALQSHRGTGVWGECALCSPP